MSECVESESQQFTRNRSVKSNKLVRSRALRESQSPPRLPQDGDVTEADDGRHQSPRRYDTSDSGCQDDHADEVFKEQTQPVEIQITPGAWDEECSPVGTQLSMDSSVLCVCGDACAAAPTNMCRLGKVDDQQTKCPTKQDSGIICPEEECLDCNASTQLIDSNGVCDERTRQIDTQNNSQDETENLKQCRCQEQNGIVNQKTELGDEVTDFTEQELINFVKETLNKSMKDRMALLRIERELIQFINDGGKYALRFPSWSSYNRLLVHRVAALFRLLHRVENKSTVVVLKQGNKTGCIPCQPFKSWCVVDLPPDDVTQPPPAKYILKRSGRSLEESANSNRPTPRSKSFEQREEEYERVRRRIFSTEECNGGDECHQWPWQGAPVKLLTSTGDNNKLLKVQSLDSTNHSGSGSCGVIKSNSFGDAQQPTRILSRQGDLASSSWRLSPSSSGYKTLSFRSTDSVTPSPTAVTPEPIMWCISETNGALLVNTQTGQPIVNNDGNVYQFDPTKPPPGHTPRENKNEKCGEKRRGRLEKQHSINQEPECVCEPNSCQCCESKSMLDWRHECNRCRVDKGTSPLRGIEAVQTQEAPSDRCTALAASSNVTPPSDGHSTNESVETTYNGYMQYTPLYYIQSPDGKPIDGTMYYQTQPDMKQQQMLYVSDDVRQPTMVYYTHNNMELPQTYQQAKLQASDGQPYVDGGYYPMQSQHDGYIVGSAVQPVAAPTMQCIENAGVQTCAMHRYSMPLNTRQQAGQMLPAQQTPGYSVNNVVPTTRQAIVHPCQYTTSAQWSSNWAPLIQQQPIQKQMYQIAQPELINYGRQYAKPDVYPVIPVQNYTVPGFIPLGIPYYYPYGNGAGGLLQAPKVFPNRTSQAEKSAQIYKTAARGSPTVNRSKRAPSADGNKRFVRQESSGSVSSAREAHKSDFKQSVDTRNDNNRVQDHRDDQTQRRDSEFATKVQKINEQMSQVTVDKERSQGRYQRGDGRRGEQRYTQTSGVSDRSYSNNGTQSNHLAPAARAILNSIRNTTLSQQQAKQLNSLPTTTYTSGKPHEQRPRPSDQQSNRQTDTRTQETIAQIQKTLDSRHYDAKRNANTMRHYNVFREFSTSNWCRHNGPSYYQQGPAMHQNNTGSGGTNHRTQQTYRR